MQTGSAADALLAALHRHGVDFLFADAVVDFPAPIESFARAVRDGAKAPRPILVPHENVADAMAHGVPVLLMAGRSPITEAGHRGSRTRFIHY